MNSSAKFRAVLVNSEHFNYCFFFVLALVCLYQCSVILLKIIKNLQLYPDNCSLLNCLKPLGGVVYTLNTGPPAKMPHFFSEHSQGPVTSLPQQDNTTSLVLKGNPPHRWSRVRLRVGRWSHVKQKRCWGVGVVLQ